jgi:hypothetical protein
VSIRGGSVLTADGLELGTQPVRTLDRTAIGTLIVPGACNVDDVFRWQKSRDILSFPAIPIETTLRCSGQQTLRLDEKE